MATYYVRTDGNDSNAGTGPATNQAWQTIGKALGATGIGSGDTLYVAPGDYRQTATITVGGTYSTATQVIANPTASQFSGIVAGRVLITNRLSNDVGNSAGNFAIFTLSSKNYLQFYNFVFEQAGASNIFSLVDSTDLQWHKCLFMQVSSQNGINVSDSTTNGLTKNYVLRQCIFSFYGTAPPYSDVSVGKNAATQNYVYSLTFDRCFFDGAASGVVILSNATSATYSGTGFYFYNCTGLGISLTNIRDDVQVKNCIGGPNRTWSTTGSLTAGGIGATISNCACFATSGLLGYTTTNLRTSKYLAYNTGIQRLWGLPQVDWFTADGLYTYATGDTSGTPAVDIYDVAWAGGAPNVGSYNNYTTTLAGQYNPTERNASTITIAPGSTSQSIELYLGATGLTFATSGLAAYYVRNQSAPVAITLVTQTATGAWSSGGFAEISSSLVPGVYRLDVPNAAFAAGASDVTIVVRGASGTNGAVLTVTLSSGGLTAAQTAAAVWDEPYTSHVTASTFGARTLKTVADNRLVNVGTANHIESNLHAVVNSTAAASELSGALLHNGTDYIDSNLISGNSTRVFVGRFDLRQTGSETVDTIEVFTTDTPSFELQLTDGDGNSVPVTGATLGLRILDVASTVVETGTPTVEYGTGGIVRWTGPGTYLAIGCPVGNYRLFIDRTVSGTTTTFGPLQIRVQAQ